MPLAKTTQVRVARGEPPANPLGPVAELALGLLAASLEQSVPLTGRGRGLGEKENGRATGLLYGLVSLRTEGLSALLRSYTDITLAY